MRDVNQDDLTRRLIDEAARLLAEHGPAGLSLRKIAVAAGTSTMAVYTRFGDKQRLLAAMHREGFRRLGARLEHAAARPAVQSATTTSDAETATADAAPTDPADDLLAVGRAYRQAALDSPDLYGLMFGPQPAELHIDESDDKAAAATFTVLVDGVRTAVRDGVLAGDPEAIALHLWVVAHGMVSLELAGQLPVPAEQAAVAYDRALLLAATPFVAPD